MHRRVWYQTLGVDMPSECWRASAEASKESSVQGSAVQELSVQGSLRFCMASSIKRIKELFAVFFGQIYGWIFLANVWGLEGLPEAYGQLP